MTIIGVSIDIAPSNSVTVYVTDQYGDGITGLEIVINSDDDSSFERVIKYTKGMKKNRAIELVPGEYMLNFKIEEAIAYFNMYPDISIKQVAHNLGFYDEYHFSKQFKKVTGLSTTDYRKQNL